MAGKKGRSGRPKGSRSGFKDPVNIVVHHAQALLQYWRAITGGHAPSWLRRSACEEASAHVRKVYADEIKLSKPVMPNVEQVLKVVTERRRPAIEDRLARKAANEAYERYKEAQTIAWKGGPSSCDAQGSSHPANDGIPNVPASTSDTL
jgi:hypothetical protein